MNIRKFDDWKRDLNNELKRRCAIDLTDIGFSENETLSLFQMLSVRPVSVIVTDLIDKYELQDITTGWQS